MQKCFSDEPTRDYKDSVISEKALFKSRKRRNKFCREKRKLLFRRDRLILLKCIIVHTRPGPYFEDNCKSRKINSEKWMAAGSGFKCHGFRQYDCKNDNRHGFDFLNVILFSVGKPEKTVSGFRSASHWKRCL